MADPLKKADLSGLKDQAAGDLDLAQMQPVELLYRLFAPDTKGKPKNRFTILSETNHLERGMHDLVESSSIPAMASANPDKKIRKALYLETPRHSSGFTAEEHKKEMVELCRKFDIDFVPIDSPEMTKEIEDIKKQKRKFEATKAIILEREPQLERALAANKNSDTLISEHASLMEQKEKVQNEIKEMDKLTQELHQKRDAYMSNLIIAHAKENNIQSATVIIGDWHAQKKSDPKGKGPENVDDINEHLKKAFPEDGVVYARIDVAGFKYRGVAFPTPQEKGDTPDINISLPALSEASKNLIKLSEEVSDDATALHEKLEIIPKEEYSNQLGADGKPKFPVGKKPTTFPDEVMWKYIHQGLILTSAAAARNHDFEVSAYSTPDARKNISSILDISENLDIKDPRQLEECRADLKSLKEKTQKLLHGQDAEGKKTLKILEKLTGGNVPQGVAELLQPSLATPAVSAPTAERPIYAVKKSYDGLKNDPENLALRNDFTVAMRHYIAKDKGGAASFKKDFIAATSETDFEIARLLSSRITQSNDNDMIKALQTNDVAEIAINLKSHSVFLDKDMDGKLTLDEVRSKAVQQFLDDAEKQSPGTGTKYTKKIEEAINQVFPGDNSHLPRLPAGEKSK